MPEIVPNKWNDTAISLIKLKLHSLIY
jgi:hypothetical protein